MTKLSQSIPCDLTMGFPLEILHNLINSAYSEITIDTSSTDIISNAYKYAFEAYFRKKEDKVTVHLPHDIKVIDVQQLETIAWGTASLQGGTKSFVLKLAHHYFVKYRMPDSYSKKAAIQLDYNGTEIYVIEGEKLNEVLTRMIRQAIQSTIKETNIPPILLEPPTIDIPFADVAVDLRRIIINDTQKTNKKNDLYFEVGIDDRKHMFGGFEVCGSTLLDLNLTYLLKKEDNPLHISVQGLDIGENNTLTNILGYAAHTHRVLNRRIQSNSLIAKPSETELQLYKDLISTHIKYNFKSVQTLIAPFVECFGTGLKSYKEIETTVSNKIYKPFCSQKSDYKLEYTIRHLNPIDISVNFLGLFLNNESDSFYLKFDYIIDGIDDNLPSTATEPGLFYPYSPGIMVSDILLKKIFKAYWDYSYILPKTFSTDYDKLFQLKEGIPTYSLSINSAGLFIDSSKLEIVTTIKPIGSKNKEPVERNTIKNSTKQIDNVDPYEELKKVKIDTDISLSSNNRLEITLGNTKPDIVHNQIGGNKKISDSFFSMITNIAAGTKINLLTLPKELTIDDRNLEITYNKTNINLNDVTIGSMVNKPEKQPVSQKKPATPSSKKDSDILLTVPKNKWGYEGTSDGHFNVPCGIAISETKKGLYVYVVDRDNNRVQKFDFSGKFLLHWGTKGSGNGQFNYPTDLSIDKDGDIYVVDSGNNRIQRFDQDGQFKTKFGSKGTGEGKFLLPQGIVVDGQGGIYVTDTNNLVQQFNPEYKFVKQWGGPGDKKGKFHSPRGITLSKKGSLYVADAGNHRIQKFNTNGKFILQWGSKGTDDGQLSFPQGLAVDSDENIYVTDTGNNRIQIFNTKGKYLTKISEEGSSIGQCLAPLGIAIDKNRNIYIADSFNYRVQKFGR